MDRVDSQQRPQQPQPRRERAPPALERLLGDVRPLLHDHNRQPLRLRRHVGVRSGVANRDRADEQRLPHAHVLHARADRVEHEAVTAHLAPVVVARNVAVVNPRRALALHLVEPLERRLSRRQQVVGTPVRAPRCEQRVLLGCARRRLIRLADLPCVVADIVVGEALRQGTRPQVWPVDAFVVDVAEDGIAEHVADLRRDAEHVAQRVVSAANRERIDRARRKVQLAQPPL